MKKVLIFAVMCASITWTASADYSYIWSIPPVQIPPPEIDYGTPTQSRSGEITSTKRQQTNLSRATLVYAGSKAKTRANLQTFVNKTRAVDPAAAAQMEQEFASGDFIGQIGGIMSSVGLSKNNVADAYALYWVNAWQVANGDSSTPSAQTMQAVSAQAARGLSSSPEFAAANDAQKQEMAEALMVQGAMIASAFEQAAGNKTQLNAIGDAVAKGARASGLELDKMTLTEDGFVPIKG
jgi:hypothetical protein